MAAAIINISGAISGLATGSKAIGPLSITSSAPNGQTQEIVLGPGANVITVPPTPACSGCVIVLPSANTQVVTLKGLAGDTGIAIGKTTTTVLNWDPTAPPASFVLSSAAGQATATEISFF